MEQEIKHQDMPSLTTMQMQVRSWQHHNFPSSTYEEPFKGMVEEIGELSHALLKMKQGIRGTTQEHEAAIQDAIGDLCIFTMDFCNKRGYNLYYIIYNVWKEVQKRDWIKYPVNGKDK